MPQSSTTTALLGFCVYCASKCQHGPVMRVKSHTKYGISVDARAEHIETRQGPNWKQLNQQQDLAKVTSLCNDLVLKMFSKSPCWICLFLFSENAFSYLFLIGLDRSKPFRPPCSGAQPRIQPPDPPGRGASPESSIQTPPVRGASPESSLQTPLVRGASPESSLQTPPVRGASPKSSLQTILVRGASPESSLQTPLVRGASPESSLQTPPVRGASPESSLQTLLVRGASPESSLQTPLFGGPAPNPASRLPLFGGPAPNPASRPPCSVGEPRIQHPDPSVRGASPESSLPTPLFGGPAPNPASRLPLFGGPAPNPASRPPCSGSQPRIQHPDPSVRGASTESSLHSPNPASRHPCSAGQPRIQAPFVRGARPESSLQTPVSSLQTLVRGPAPNPPPVNDFWGRVYTMHAWHLACSTWHVHVIHLYTLRHSVAQDLPANRSQKGVACRWSTTSVLFRGPAPLCYCVGLKYLLYLLATYMCILLI